MDVRRMDIVALKRAFIEKTKEFTAKLLQGVPWEKLQKEKREVTFLSIELDKRLHRNNNAHPAEYPFRNGGS